MLEVCREVPRHMSRLCKSSPGAITEAVAALSLLEVDETGFLQSSDDDITLQMPIAAGLRDLASGHLLAEAPGLVDATVAAVLPCLCNARVASQLNWQTTFAQDGVSQDESAAVFVSYFASRAAASLSYNLDLSGLASTNVKERDGILIGTLGETTRLLQACAALLDHAFELERPRLPDRTLADLLFSCERVAESGKLVSLGRDENKESVMSSVVANIRTEALAIATSLSVRLPSLGKRTPTTAALIVRLWRPAAGRDGLQKHIFSALKVEDAVISCDATLERLSLVPVTRVVRSFVDKLDRDDIVAVLHPVLAVCLPVASDVSQQRRLDALQTLSRVLMVCPAEVLAEDGKVLVDAFAESLAQQDCATALLAVPALAKALTLVYAPVTLANTPPNAWDEAFKEVLLAFTSRVARPPDDVAEADQKLLTAAAVAIHIPRIAQGRLVQQMDSILRAMESGLLEAGRAVSRHGEDYIPAYTAIKEAYVEVLRYTWPRVPAHIETIIRGTFVSVLSARGAPPKVVSKVVQQAADLLTWAAKCGHRLRFHAILDGMRPSIVARASLGPAAELLAMLDEQLKDLLVPDITIDRRMAGNALVREFVAV